MSIQTLADLRSYVSGLINDPSYTRYGLPLIDSQLDLCQHRWNMEAKICRDTDNIPLVANQYRYPIKIVPFSSNPIQILRVTHMGIPLTIRSKSYMDQYSGNNWLTDQGTPKDFIIDLNSNNNLSAEANENGPTFILHPTPQAADVATYSNNVGVLNQYPLTIEYICPHTPMVNPSDQPFTVGTTYFNALMIPFLAGLGVDAAASILEPDPTAETVKKAQIFRSQANGYLSLVVQMYQGLEEDNPSRMKGGRAWTLGNSGNLQSW